MGIQIPIIRQLIGFVYLTFVPGFLIIRALKFNKFNCIETLLYSVGLSIATLMLIGLFINIFYPFFGIYKPISLLSLIVTFSIIVSILCIVCHYIDNNYSNQSCINLRNALSPSVLFLCIIPFLAVFGTYLMNFHQNNFLLMFLIIMIAFVAVLIGSGFISNVPERLYPLAIFIISISLLYHSSLISTHLWGMDIQIAYYFSSLTISNSYWDPTIPSNANALLSEVMLASIYSIICDMSLTWVFKIIYPFLFSFVPLGLYQLYREQIPNKIAFLSSFFFMSFFTFYTEMLQLPKQQIAELFVVLLLLLIMNKEINKVTRSVLLTVFAASLIVSHYGTSYIFLILLIIARTILALREISISKRLINRICYRFNKCIESYTQKDGTISLTFILLFIVFAISWYLYIASCSVFNAIVFIAHNVISTIYTEFLNPEVSQSSYLLFHITSPLHNITKILHHITHVFILIGVISLVSPRRRFNFHMQYSVFSIAAFLILVSTILIPYFGLGTPRLYHLLLIFLAPFCIVGGILFLEVIVKFLQYRIKVQTSLMMLSTFFAIFFLFNSGFVYNIVGKEITSISLNSPSQLDFPRFNDMEIVGSEWLLDNKESVYPIYADMYRGLLFVRFGKEFKGFSPSGFQLTEKCYVFFGTWNVLKGEIVKWYRGKGMTGTAEYIESSSFVVNKNKIYDNGGVQVYH